MIARNMLRQGSSVVFPALALLALMGLAGCGSDSSTNPPPDFAAPTNVRVANGDQNITIRWDASTNESDSDFKRYNIYRGTSSLIGVSEDQLDQLGYKVGTATSANRSFTTTVANGTLYYFHVRGEKNDGTLSHPSDEKKGAGRLEGEGKIIVEFAATGTTAASISPRAPRSRCANTNPDRFTLTDIYLGTSDATDDSGSPLSLKSPESLLDRFDADGTARSPVSSSWEPTGPQIPRPLKD